MIGRRLFADVVARQLDLFDRDEAELIRECDEAEAAYVRASRDEAEERYADYLDLVESATEALASLRDNYASSLEEEGAEAYERAFNRAVARRFSRFELEDT